MQAVGFALYANCMSSWGTSIATTIIMIVTYYGAGAKSIIASIAQS
jgi:hypothetical protein